jgi:hypothetical protein
MLSGLLLEPVGLEGASPVLTVDGSTVRGRQLAAASVSGTGALEAALANNSVSRILVEAGHYLLSSQLTVSRNVIIEAEVYGAVVLDGQGSTRLVQIVAGVVELIGVNITGGSVSSGNVSASQLLRNPTALVPRAV